MRFFVENNHLRMKVTKLLKVTKPIIRNIKEKLSKSEKLKYLLFKKPTKGRWKTNNNINQNASETEN